MKIFSIDRQYKKLLSDTIFTMNIEIILKLQYPFVFFQINDVLFVRTEKEKHDWEISTLNKARVPFSFQKTETFSVKAVKPKLISVTIHRGTSMYEYYKPMSIRKFLKLLKKIDWV